MRWLRTLLLCVQSSLLAKLCQGAVECICTTAECHTKGTNTCTAEHFCYVQSMVNPLEGGDKTPMIIRGCIDDRTPLLCENRVPGRSEISRALWPVLHCCRDIYCNKDVVPTPGPEDDNDEYELEPGPVRGTPLTRENTPSIEREYNPYEETNSDSQTLAINPLYIGVPVAGACVLLAIIIFAIYILKRQNRYLEDNYRNNLRQQGCVKPLTQEVKHPNCSCRDTCAYQDCERSSNGSETRLLMKV